MRACFLGQNICALGYGVAMLQTPPLVVDDVIAPAGSANSVSNDRNETPHRQVMPPAVTWPAQADRRVSI